MKRRRKNLDVTSMNTNRSPQRLKSAEMKIDRSITDDATPGQRNGCFFFATKERSQNANRRAHLTHNLVWSDAIHLFGLYCHNAARPFHFCTQMCKNLEHVMNIAQVRYALNDAGFLRQKRRR